MSAIGKPLDRVDGQIASDEPASFLMLSFDIYICYIYVCVCVI